jgi:hypothetical protein
VYSRDVKLVELLLQYSADLAVADAVRGAHITMALHPLRCYPLCLELRFYYWVEILCASLLSHAACLYLTLFLLYQDGTTALMAAALLEDEKAVRALLLGLRAWPERARRALCNQQDQVHIFESCIRGLGNQSCA